MSTPRLDPSGSHARAGADKIIQISLASTGAFGALSLVAYLLADRLDLIFAVTCGIVFTVGTLLLGLGIWNGIQRSRTDSVTLTGLLAVDKSHVPSAARNRLWLAVLLQTVIAIAFGSLRPFTEQAFGLLVPMLGLGFAGLWGSRFAVFHPREDP